MNANNEDVAGGVELNNLADSNGCATLCCCIYGRQQFMPGLDLA